MTNDQRRPHEESGAETAGEDVTQTVPLTLGLTAVYGLDPAARAILRAQVAGGRR